MTSDWRDDCSKCRLDILGNVVPKFQIPKFTLVEHHNCTSRIFFARTKSYWVCVLWKSINHDDNPCDFDCCCLLTDQLCIRLQQGRAGRPIVDNWLCISRAILIQTDGWRQSATHKDNESSTIIQTDIWTPTRQKLNPQTNKSHFNDYHHWLWHKMAKNVNSGWAIFGPRINFCFGTVI